MLVKSLNEDVQFIRRATEEENAPLTAHRRLFGEPPPLKIDFAENDNRLRLTSDSRGARFVGTLDGAGPVVCIEAKAANAYGAGGSTHTEIYKRISRGTLVQAFYGIWMHDGKHFAVMEDLTDQPSLAKAIATKQVPAGLTRLRIVYQLANTVAYFHSVGIILKSLSDEMVVLRNFDQLDKVQPCLTEIQRARMVGP